MFEFGASLRWAAGAGTDCISPEAAPQLCAKPSCSNPGFVTLFWARTSGAATRPRWRRCRLTVRRLMWDFCRATSSDEDITCSGPAVNVRGSDDNNGGEDHVPCLRLQW